MRHAAAVTAGGGSLRADAGDGLGNPDHDGSFGAAGIGALDGGPAADGGELPPFGFTAAGACEPTGIFALRMQADVAWGGRSNGLANLTDNGRGLAVVDAKLTVEHVAPDGSFTATLQACNAEMPPFFSTTLCEAYQPQFPSMLWDHPSMPRFPVTGGFTCGGLGCVLRFDKVVAPIGIQLDPIERKWPTSAETLALSCPSGIGKQCFSDQDGDMQAGVTVAMRNSLTTPPNQPCPMGYPFRSPPLSDNPAAIYNGVQRADQLYLGVRVNFSGEALLGADCIRGLGKGIANGFDSRAPGCRVQTGTLNWPDTTPAPPGTYCSDAQRQFIDDSLPNYYVLKEGAEPDPVLNLVDKSVSPGTRVKVARVGRLGEFVGCGAVRAALF